MAKYILFPFAVTGNRLAVPDPAQPSGNLSWQEGFPVNYQLDPATEPTAKLIERQQFNQFMFDLSAAVQQYQQFGVPEFITTSDNAGAAFAYSQFARVRFGGSIYESLVDNNTATPADASKWSLVSVGGNGIPAGLQAPYGGNAAPNGWLLCYGQAVSRVTYSALFAAIGTNYGVGDSINTFNVPDKRGRTSVGKDDMGGAAANRITNGVAGFVGTQIGAAGGNQNVQQHTHAATVNDPGHAHNAGTPVGIDRAGEDACRNADLNSGPTSVSTTGIEVTNATFGTGSSGNVQPSQVDNWIIKT